MEGLVQVQLGPGKLECRALFFLEGQADGPSGDPGSVRGKHRFLKHPLELLQILGPVILAQKGDGFRFHPHDMGILHMVVGLDVQQGIIQDLIPFVPQGGKQDRVELEPFLQLLTAGFQTFLFFTSFKGKIQFGRTFVGGDAEFVQQILEAPVIQLGQVPEIEGGMGQEQGGMRIGAKPPHIRFLQEQGIDAVQGSLCMGAFFIQGMDQAVAVRTGFSDQATVETAGNQLQSPFPRPGRKELQNIGQSLEKGVGSRRFEKGKVRSALFSGNQGGHAFYTEEIVRDLADQEPVPLDFQQGALPLFLGDQLLFLLQSRDLMGTEGLEGLFPRRILPIQELSPPVKVKNGLLLAPAVLMEQAGVSPEGLHIRADIEDVFISFPYTGGAGRQKDALEPQPFRLDHRDRIPDDQGIALLLQLQHLFFGIMPFIDDEDVVREV